MSRLLGDEEKAKWYLKVCSNFKQILHAFTWQLFRVEMLFLPKQFDNFKGIFIERPMLLMNEYSLSIIRRKNYRTVERVWN